MNPLSIHGTRTRHASLQKSAKSKLREEYRQHKRSSRRDLSAAILEQLIPAQSRRPRELCQRARFPEISPVQLVHRQDFVSPGLSEASVLQLGERVGHIDILRNKNAAGG